MERSPKSQSINALHSKEHCSIESSANFEGNDTELFFERLSNPVIEQQVVDTLYEAERTTFDFYKEEVWEPYLPEGWTGIERWKLLKGKKSKLVIDEDFLKDKLQKEEPKREEVEKKLLQSIREIQNQTEIDFTTNQPNADVICLNWKLPWTNEKATPKQMSIIEAHEKGHRIRLYDHLTKKFIKAFDLSKVVFTEDFHALLKKDIEVSKQNEEYEDEKELTREERREEYLNHYLFTASEIVERMSQLKNYFGFRDDEKFTKEHLAYAREHYTDDTGMDNGMTMFFEAITPETEEYFLEIINSVGV